MIKSLGYAAKHSFSSLKPFEFEREDPKQMKSKQTYSPMKHWGVKAGDKVGILGFGGLGDMAAKLAKAMGADVYVFTSTREKLEEATRLGVTGVLEGDEDAAKAHKASFHLILSPTLRSMI